MTAAELERVAEELELDVVGAAPASAYASTERHIAERKARGLFADMRFTMARPEVSCHPETLLPGARTVVSAAHCYYALEPPLEPGEGRLARYTWHDGYAVLRERLDELGRRLGGEYRVLVDANQHVDREGAARSGVGFYGKNTMLITRRHGSWIVLGTLVTTADVEATAPLELDCGSCTLCIEACPTGALDEPGVVDASKCLSYWTQAPAPIPEEYRAELGAQVPPPAGRDHHGLPQPERLHERRLQILGARQIELDPHEPVVHRTLEEPGDGGGRDAEGLGDVLLAARLAIVELQALDHLPDLARGLRN